MHRFLIVDVNRSISWYCNIIKGTWELHSMRNKDMGEIFAIKTTKYACFCEVCNDIDGCILDQCERHAYVK